MSAATVRACQKPEGHWKLWEHELRTPRCPQGVEGCWPSAMMVNVRPCALVTRRAVEVDVSRGREHAHCESETSIHKTCFYLQFAALGRASKTLPHSENCCAMELNPSACWT